MIPLKLDIGCGTSPAEGFVGLDRRKLPGVQIVWDLENGLAIFADASVAEIRASHSLEHIRNLIFLMYECGRVLMPGGTLTVIAPSVADAEGKCFGDAFADPTHVRYFDLRSLFFYVKGSPESTYLAKDTGQDAPFEGVEQHFEGKNLHAVLRKAANALPSAG